MDIDKQEVLELLYDAIEREDWSLVEEATRVIKGEVDFDEFETDDDVDILFIWSKLLTFIFLSCISTKSEWLFNELFLNLSCKIIITGLKITHIQHNPAKHKNTNAIK